MQLYKLNAQVAACVKIDEERMVDTETGEIMDLEAFAALVAERDVKMEGLLLYIKNRRSEADAIKAEIEKLQKRERAARAEVERCKNYAADQLRGEKFKTSKVKTIWRNSTVCEVLDIKEIPEQYLRFKEPEADKTAIKKAFKNGVNIPGAEVIDRKVLVIQ